MRLQYAYSPTTNQSGDLSEHDASKGQQLIYIPKHTGSVWFNMAFKNFDINWMTYYLGQRQTSTVADQLFFPEPSFWLTHLSVGTNWEFKPIKVSVKFKIDNLFNAEYANIKDRPMPLRNYAVMLKFDIK